MIAADENTDIGTMLKDLAKERDNLNQASPQTFKWAYTKAKAGIEAGEADYAVDRCGPDK